MCDKVKLEKRLTKGRGFKVFGVSFYSLQGEESGLIGDWSRGDVRPEGKWIDEKDFRPPDSYLCQMRKKSWIYGWMIFLERADAETWLVFNYTLGRGIIKEVEFKNGRAGTASVKGLIGYRKIEIPVAVAKQIKILQS